MATTDEKVDLILSKLATPAPTADDWLTGKKKLLTMLIGGGVVAGGNASDLLKDHVTLACLTAIVCCGVLSQGAIDAVKAWRSYT